MKRIFLVEDDKAIAKNLMLLLRSEGYTVTHAPTQSEAIDFVSVNRFDLALVDISLPDGNGFTVCTEIKETQDIPVIFLTASGDEASVVTGLNMGADDYITKPFRPRELIARIKTALRKSVLRHLLRLLSCERVTRKLGRKRWLTRRGTLPDTQFLIATVTQSGSPLRGCI